MSEVPLCCRSHNNLPDVPPDLGTLSSLTHLDLSYNQLVGALFLMGEVPLQ